jgi:cell division protein FtsW (lipid II flippase)
MNADTCAVLASVFPLTLLTVVLELRGVHFNLRSRKWFRRSVVIGMAFSLIGLVLAVVGVAIGGYSEPQSVFLWGSFGISIVAMAIIALGIVATAENENDKELAKRR